jgi:hypothetical protein
MCVLSVEVVGVRDNRALLELRHHPVFRLCTGLDTRHGGVVPGVDLFRAGTVGVGVSQPHLAVRRLYAGCDGLQSVWRHPALYAPVNQRPFALGCFHV